MTTAELDAVDTIRHLERAIDLHLERLARDYVPPPAGLLAVRDALAGAPESLDVPNVADSTPAGDDADVLAYNRNQVRRLLGGISTSTLHRIVQRGDLRKVSIGGCPRYLRSDLDAYLEGR